tara:strand:- start:128547 stop:129542 length:996 start_codon:yes stop_codon:yes gene_type:complete
MSQIARMFLRGSLVKVTAKNLTEKQKKEVTELMIEVWNDSRLDNAKHEFCQALGRTIGGEYSNKEFAMQEVWLTLWRTATDVLFHNPKQQVINNHIIRKKHFQTCIFNYLRQILTENKIPKTNVEREIAGPASYVAQEMISFFLANSNSKLDYEFAEDTQAFSIETGLIPLDVIKKIWKLQKESAQFVTITLEDEKISIITHEDEKYLTKTVKEKVRIKQSSFTGTDEEDNNGFQQYCEYQSVKKREREVDQMVIEDTVTVLRDRLPIDTQKVFDILIHQPKAFLEAYYPRRRKEVRPKEIHIAEWLGLSKEDVVDHIKVIQDQAVALDIG